MLDHLHIENMAVIESADLDLRSGFTVLTGETGAGKSVLIHSLNLLLGDRVLKDCVRAGCEKASVSGLFTGLSESVRNVLSENGIDVSDDELLIRRDLTADGKTTVRINGAPATLNMLRSVTGYLVNIHGQHDNRALLDPATHVRYLDAYAKDDALLAEYKKIFSELKELLSRIRAVSLNEQERMQKIDLLEYQINEIDAAALRPGEEEELSARRVILGNAEKIESSLQSACEALSGDGNGRDLVNDAAGDLSSVENFDSALADLAQRLNAICSDLQDVAFDLRDYLDNRSFDPAELDTVEERLDLIHRLKKKYAPTCEEILEYRQKAAAELDTLRNSAATQDALTAEKTRLFAELKRAGEVLTAARNQAAQTLQTRLCEQLAFLDMPNARFSVRIVPAGEFTPEGADKVEFLLSANPGEPLHPLSRIASGGELSRIMLSMKTVLTVDEDASTLIFDEVDAGVSGKAAEKIAMKLKDLSAGKQVLVVTHLAQIASYADEHLLIAKSVSGDRTYTSVTPLDHAGRRSEIARIVGGLNPTPAAVAAAEDLLAIGAAYGK